MDYKSRYALWCAANLPGEIKEELNRISDNEEELKSCFGTELQFGTAGMRGIMGIGSNRLNYYTVRRAAQGMASWLASTDLPKKAAIAYDSRHNSCLFAQVCAVAFAEKGIKTFLFDRLAPTPMLSFAVRHLQCGCGIVISASHNSSEYNGVKCYGPDGCQMTDGPAAIVTEIIAGIPHFVPESNSFEFYLASHAIQYINQDLWEDYYETVLGEMVAPAAIEKVGLNVVYTPLCGTGNEPVREVLGRVGVNVAVVASQERPDGDFRTCEYPNPETDSALLESYKTASANPCDLVLATDPDCDRVAIAVPVNGEFWKLSGNELGCLLLDYILGSLCYAGKILSDCVAVRSIVSSPLADRIAANYGVNMKAVLTGFKYIGGEILRLEERGEEKRFLFGFEESCGYLKGTYARDKDAVVTSLLICEMAAFYKEQNKSILDALNELYERYGFYLAHVQNIELTGSDAMEKAARIMSGFRAKTPTAIGSNAVTEILDYRAGEHIDVATGIKKEIDLPRSNVLEYRVGTKGSIIIRPSGTEPKVKFYYTAIGKTEAEAKELLSRMKQDMSN